MILPNDDYRIVKRSTANARCPVTCEFIPIGFHDPFTRENQYLTHVITIIRS